MPGLQSLLEKFVTTTHGYTTDSETVFSHPLTDARIALATDDETIRALAVYGWIVAEPGLSRALTCCRHCSEHSLNC